ncbi:MAG: LysR family transcriptional regulator, partial [Clostridiales bacterium]|nr:LysR family transcriptional regulator [Clostridiales bacterium]
MFIVIFALVAQVHFSIHSQPTITKEMHSFEEALGCKLFVRASKGIRLTPEGQILYEKIVPVVESLMQTEAMMKQIGHHEEGHLVLGANCKTVEHLLRDSVTQYTSEYPGIGVQYLLAKRNIQDSALENGLADIGFSFRPYHRDFALTERELIQKSHHTAYIWQPNVEIYRLLVSDVILVVGSHLRNLQEQ